MLFLALLVRNKVAGSNPVGVDIFWIWNSATWNYGFFYFEVNDLIYYDFVNYFYDFVNYFVNYSMDWNNQK